jgi:hypothetical protein
MSASALSRDAIFQVFLISRFADLRIAASHVEMIRRRGTFGDMVLHWTKVPFLADSSRLRLPAESEVTMNADEGK